MQKSGDTSFTVHLFPDDNSLMTRAITLRYWVDFNSSSDAVGNKNVNAAHFQPVYKEPDEMDSEFHNNKTQTFTGKSALAKMFLRSFWLDWTQNMSKRGKKNVTGMACISNITVRTSVSSNSVTSVFACLFLPHKWQTVPSNVGSNFISLHNVPKGWPDGLNRA